MLGKRHFISLIGLFGLFSGGLSAQTGNCAALTSFVMSGVTITAATSVPAGSFTSPSQVGYPSATYTVPAFCRVQAIISPQITTEVWLPASWNNRFQGEGDGGWLGAVIYAGLANAINGGYATVSSDLGHQSLSFDATWANGHPDLVTAFGVTATHLMTVLGQQLTTQYYGKPSTYTYFLGCSAGGRQSLMEAENYPNDYNGIISCAPAQDWTRMVSGWVWQSLAVMGDPNLTGYLSSTQVQRLYQSVIAACDSLDGIKDGIIADPRNCNYDPQPLACGSVTTPYCLTPAQVTAVRKVYSPLVNSSNAQLYPASPRGSENEWACGFLGSAPYNGFSYLASQTFYQNVVYEIPSWDFRTFNPDVDVPNADQKDATTLNASSPNLDAFQAAGGKLFMYHGWADAIITPYATIDYFNSVVARYGSTPTSAFYRLFMEPGVGHCGAVGPSIFDPQGVIQTWVESGIAPSSIIAYAVNSSGSITMSRPLCPYPQAASYNGSGSTSAARNFTCK